MDVVCGRCRAEYEFDDALISERGTTVRCTNCGLQFKVFPPIGLRAPEVWLVFDPRDARVEPVRYDSLREMQKDIARGAVTGEHLLARGDEAPRRLREIVELQPLLHQPRSEPPPPVDSVHVDAPPPPPVGMKTVLGVAQRPDPSAHSGSLSPPRPPEDSSGDVDEHAIVPDQPSETRIPVSQAKPRDGKPRIRSALSVSPFTTQSSSLITREDAGPELDDVEGRASIPPPRQSLRSTLAGSSASQRPSPVPGEANPPSSRSRVPLSERGTASPTPVAEKSPASEKQGSALVGPVKEGLTLPVEPTISESREYPGVMTPTPTGVGAYNFPEADPVSSIANVHVKQSARTGGIVLVVLLGGAAFLGFANRDKLSLVLAGSRSEQVDPETAPPETPPELVRRLQMADAAWISASLLNNPDGEFPATKRDELKKLQSELSALGVTQSWEKVNLLRAAGDLVEAREMAGSLEKTPEQPYALALLDLAEEKDNPPWPIVIERLREASSGERGRFLARSAYIYSLAASGALPRAVADFEALSQLVGGTDAPLYGELRAYLERLGAFEGKAEDSDSQSAPSIAREEESQEPASEEPTKREPAALMKAAEPAERPPAKPKVSDVIKGQVAQADAMWRGGNQEGALVIYRQVVAKIGTKHYLGQRSAARIAQAEREGAAGK